LGYDSE